MEPKGPATETINIEAGNFYFKPDKITADAGIAKIELTAENGHPRPRVRRRRIPGFQLEADGGGGTKSKKIDLKPGKYTFYCSIPGHRAAGHGRHAHRQVSRVERVAGTTHRAARPATAVERAPGAGRRARRSPTARPAAVGVERLDGSTVDAAPRCIVTMRVVDVRAAEHRRERAQELDARHRPDDAHVEQAVVHRRRRA